MDELESGQGQDLVVVLRAPDEYTATLVKNLLEGEGIPVVLESRQVAWMDGVMKMGEGYWGDVVVPREHAETSLRLIAEYQQKAALNDEDVDSGQATD